MVFFMLNLLALQTHQILELTDSLYQRLEKEPPLESEKCVETIVRLIKQACLFTIIGKVAKSGKIG